MKKLIMVSVIGLSLLTGATQAYASESTTTEPVELEVGAGIKPGNPFYTVDKGLEKFRLWLTVGDEKKADLMLRYAEERLSELDELDEDALDKYAPGLYDAYGRGLNHASERISERLAKGNATEKLERLKERLVHVAEVEQTLDTEKTDAIALELREKVRGTQAKSIAISIATNMEQEEVDSLREQNFGYGEILKLKAFSELSETSIDALLELDVYVETEDGEREIDFGKLAIELGLVKTNAEGELLLDEEGNLIPDMEAIRDQFKQYHTVIVQNRKEEAKMNKELKGFNKSERANERQKRNAVMEERREAARERFEDRLDLILEERLVALETRIETIYQNRVAAINASELSETRKEELIAELDAIKVELNGILSERVEADDFQPRDLGALYQAIINGYKQEVEELELTEDEETIFNLN